MRDPSNDLNRRAFVHGVGNLAVALAGATLTGCGGKESSAAPPAPAAPVTETLPPPAATTAPATDADGLNFALNLEYIGAQFYGYAANGVGLPASLVAGTGRQGNVIGGRKASLSDPIISQYMAELAGDKLANVTLLRAQLSNAAAAQPEMDFSPGASSPFSAAAQMAGIAASGAAFDPFSGDRALLLGALFLQDRIAAAYRTLAGGLTAGASSESMKTILAGAIYHGGLIRSILSMMAAADSTLASSITSMIAFLSRLDGSDRASDALAGSDGPSSDIVDTNGMRYPFTRTQAQFLNIICLGSGSSRGGFLPYGLNPAAN